MPWKESRIVDQRLQFLSTYQKEEMSVSDLCREFGVSRQTGYRWINRYKEVGPEGLLNRSSKPNGCSHATTEAIENEIFALRRKYPSWGARKLKARLEMLDPEVNWPASIRPQSANLSLSQCSMSALAIMRQLNRGRGEPAHLEGQQPGR